MIDGCVFLKCFVWRFLVNASFVLNDHKLLSKSYTLLDSNTKFIASVLLCNNFTNLFVTACFEVIISFSAVRSIRPLSVSYLNAANIISNSSRNYGTLQNLRIPIHTCIGQNSLLNNKQILDISSNLSAIPVRTVTKFSLQKGKRKSVKAVVRRFFRLHWGGWIRTKVGRNKKMWKKSSSQKRRLRQHVFCNSTQSTMLDKMVTKFWKRPKYYVDDPYAPYHTREEFVTTRKKPFVKQWNDVYNVRIKFI